MNRHLKRLALAATALASLLAILPTPAWSSQARLGDPTGDVARADATTRIVGGSPVERFPRFMASLQRFDQPWFVHDGWAHACGALVIHPRWALTAQHCVEFFPGEDRRVRLRIGSSRWDRGGEIVRVIRMIDASGPDRWTPDLALLELERAVDVVPIRIGEVPDERPARMRVLGWGLTTPPSDDQQIAPLPPRRLRGLAVEIVERRACRAATVNELCVASVRPMSGPCNFDSGGPMLRRTADGWTLIGTLVGSGNPIPAPACISESMYTNVPRYRDWIEETIGEPLP